MPIKYKLYTATERGQYFEEFYSKPELEKHKIEPDEDIDLFECASRMVNRFNRTLREGEDSRYAYKLEKISVRVIGSFAFSGLGVSHEMCEPEFK